MNFCAVAPPKYRGGCSVSAGVSENQTGQFKEGIAVVGDEAVLQFKQPVCERYAVVQPAPGAAAPKLQHLKHRPSVLIVNPFRRNKLHPTLEVTFGDAEEALRHLLVRPVVYVVPCLRFPAANPVFAEAAVTVVKEEGFVGQGMHVC